jgi:hypothetical protein
MWHLMALYLLHRFIVGLFDEDIPGSGVVYFPITLNSDFKGVIILPCLTFQSLPVTWYTNKVNIQQLYALTTLCFFLFCIYLRTNSDLCHLHHKLVVFITEMKSVYSAVRTGALNKAVCTSSLKGQSHSTKSVKESSNKLRLTPNTVDFVKG